MNVSTFFPEGEHIEKKRKKGTRESEEEEKTKRAKRKERRVWKREKVHVIGTGRKTGKNDISRRATRVAFALEIRRTDGEADQFGERPDTRYPNVRPLSQQ